MINLEFYAELEAKDMQNQNTVCEYPGSETPQCSVLGVDAGPPFTVFFAVISPIEGLASISIEEAVNAEVIIPSFTVGTTQEIIVEVQKVDDFADFSVVLEVKDSIGNSTTCQYNQQAQQTAFRLPKDKSVDSICL